MMTTDSRIKLEPYREREFYHAGISWSDTVQASQLLEDLIQLPVRVDADSVEFFSRWRELAAILHEESASRYLAMTLDTKDPAKLEAYNFFSQKLQPILSEKSQRLKERVLSEQLLNFRCKAEAPEFFRKLQSDAEIFRVENIPLQMELSRLSQEYQKLSAGLTLEWEGKQVTVTQLAPEQEKRDRSLRERAWRAEWQRRMQERKTLDDLFSRMLELRAKVARNAGFESYRDYAFRDRHRFDYSPDDCLRLHQAIQLHIAPIIAKQIEQRKNRLNISTVRPWDMGVDLYSDAPLAPYSSAADLVAKVGQVFDGIDSGLATLYQGMISKGLVDLENRPGKAPGGYQLTFAEARLPFVFMNAVGVHSDVRTLIHEAGHAFHTLLTRDQDFFQRSAPMEFCEVASMSMELIALRESERVFGAKTAAQLRRNFIFQVPMLFARIAMIDSFQHWLYTDASALNAETRHQKWMSLHRQYLGGIESSGIEAELEIGWHRVLHLFQFPFYYVEYGVAQLGAIELWDRFISEPQAALEDYRRSLSAGGTLGLKELFQRANLGWPFREETVANAARILTERLDQESSIC